MSLPLSPRSLRFDSAATRLDRLYAAAHRHGISAERLVLPAEGLLRGRDPELHYLEWPGPQRGPSVLMLHGGGLHAHTFDLVGNLVSRHARCVALDLRGHGESGWAGPGQYGASAIADDIDAVVCALQLAPVVVVGHSVGGMGAMVWAARSPEGLAALMIVDVAPGMNQEGTGSVHEFVAANPTFTDLDDVDRFFARGTTPSVAAGDSAAANLRWDANGRLAFKYDTAQFAGIDLPLGDELRAVAARIDAPTRVLRGQRSKVIDNEAAAELAGLIPGASWAVVPDAGHTIQSSNPAGLAAEIIAIAT
ncbi:alpha/beta hydrolase [Candidatus Mycobacterium wuenschmannii]|uniref:Alpha/beta hydrolase n=1 Tax=Candidatus Mycobacterium wuenschmannii TaxID=3027808 RepID=A0ABY8VXQ1_9MYCO|nr:alpha/beta hydrolase [Candidatus Mycobacterium wuenschmannii]WIM88081.1 alpha/beta hydrolase [Candidatus Mycobacterium wuenschmannii]